MKVASQMSSSPCAGKKCKRGASVPAPGLADREWWALPSQRRATEGRFMVMRTPPAATSPTASFTPWGIPFDGFEH